MSTITLPLLLVNTAGRSRDTLTAVVAGVEVAVGLAVGVRVIVARGVSPARSVAVGVGVTVMVAGAGVGVSATSNPSAKVLSAGCSSGTVLPIAKLAVY